jgi:hypothetical protein
LITAAAAIVAVLAILTLLVEVRWHNHQPYSGDEPHYLVMTNSLIQDGDFDVKNDYLAGRFRRYHPTGSTLTSTRRSSQPTDRTGIPSTASASQSCSRRQSASRTPAVRERRWSSSL